MFNYICEECGKGTVKEKIITNYHTKIKGYPFVVPSAIIGICDSCGAKHYDSNETKRWANLYEIDKERKHETLLPDEITDIRKSLGLSMEDFAYLIGCTRQSISNWEKSNRIKPQSRMADLLIKLVRLSFDVGKVGVLDFLINESKILGVEISLKNKITTLTGKVFQLNLKRVPSNYFESGEGIALAADAIKENEMTIAETLDHKLSGVLQYDFIRAALFFIVKINKMNLEQFDFELITDDNKNFIIQNKTIADKKILLLDETVYRENNIKQIYVKLK